MITLGDILLGIGVLINVALVFWVLWRTWGITGTIQKLEVNTNSIKDALLKTTAESEYAKGVLEGKASVRQPGTANDPTQ